MLSNAMYVLCPSKNAHLIAYPRDGTALARRKAPGGWQPRPGTHVMQTRSLNPGLDLCICFAWAEGRGLTAGSANLDPSLLLRAFSFLASLHKVLNKYVFAMK